MVRRVVLVTGATGFIGRHLVPRLQAENAVVRVVTRTPDRLPAEWRHLVEVVEGDLFQPSVQVAATKGIELIYHLAAEIRDHSRMHAINVEAVLGLMDSAVRAGVKRIVHVSSVAVIGAVRSGIVTEAEPCRPQNQYERTKLEGEEVVRGYAQSGRIEAVILRPTNVFGERRDEERDSFLGWLRAVKQRRFVFFGRKSIANYIYVGDVVEALVRLSNHPVEKVAVYTATDPVPMADFVESMARALDVPTPTRYLPRWAGYVLGAICDGVQLALRVPMPLTLTQVRALSSRTEFCGRSLLKDLSLTFPFGCRKGLELTVQGYRWRGQL